LIERKKRFNKGKQFSLLKKHIWNTTTFDVVLLTFKVRMIFMLDIINFNNFNNNLLLLIYYLLIIKDKRIRFLEIIEISHVLKIIYYC